MKSRIFRLTSLIMLVALMSGLATTLQAQEPRPSALDRKEQTPHRTLPNVDVTLPAGTVGGPQAQAYANNKIKLVIELEGEPTAVVYSKQLATGNKAQATNAAKTQLASVEQAQLSVLSQLKGLDVTVMYRTQRVINSIAVQVNAKDVPRLRQLSGVKAIRPLITKYVDHTTSVPLIGAPELWDPANYGLAGENITIGIIDTGIDYTHANYGGAGTAAAYNNNDSTVITDTAEFPNVKVAGGYDFVGDAYNPNVPALSIPVPDPDPLDCDGHGTHVAGTAAGFGVTKAGATYTGAYTGSLNMDQFRIGPGVAPEATLYALKVFGCDGSTDALDVAIEWAVDPNGDGDFDDRLDVINMSLGSDFGDTEDSSSIASDNAVLAGVIVVAAAGNSGDTNYISGSPGAANRVIAVASSVDASSVFDAFRVSGAITNTVLNTLHPGRNSVAYPWSNPAATLPPTTTLPLTATLYYPPVAEARGCAPFSAATKSQIAGKIVLLDWYEPSCGGSVGRGRNVRQAGGVGALMIDYQANNPDAFDLFITSDPIIPTQSIPKEVGDALKAELAVNPNLKASFSRQYNQTFAFSDEQFVDTMSDFSSRGPGSAGGLKPDITAPGQSIFSAGVGTGNLGANFSGTSMAAPHIAGGMALLRELHPDWSVEELKALVMNTATVDIRTTAALTSTLYSPTRQGAGRVVLPNAAQEDVMAYSQDSGAVSVSFGNVEVLGQVTMSKSFIVENKSNQARSFNLSYDDRSTIPGVSYTLSDTSITVGANDTELVTVVMEADADLMTHTADPALIADQSDLGVGRFWLSEAAGYINFSETPSPTKLGVPSVSMRLPLYATARPASLMQAEDSTVDLDDSDTDSFDVNLVGVDFANGPPNSVEQTVSLVHALELHALSPNDLSSEGASNGADLQAIGAMSDVNATDFFTETLISIGVATYDDWVTPQPLYDVEFDVYFDTNGDGEDDFVMFNYNFAQANGGGDATDDFVTVVVNLTTGRLAISNYINYLPPGFLDTAPFHNNVLVLPVDARQLGLTAADSDFHYTVVSYQRFEFVDVSPRMYYDAANPGIDTSGGFTGSPWYQDLNGSSIPVDFNRADASRSKALGLLLLHHNNIKGRRAEVVRFDYDLIEYKIYMPIILK